MSGYIDIDGKQWEHCVVCGALIERDQDRCDDHKGLAVDVNGQLEWEAMR